MMRSSKPITTIPDFLIISFIVIILISFIGNSTSQAPIYVGDDCHNSTPQALTTSYKANLNQVLSWISTNAATSKGYNHTVIGNIANDAVYGLYDCRGDAAGYLCQFCVSTATREVPQRCPNRPSAVIWYDYCILRYSNKNFFGKVTTNPWWYNGGTKKVSDSTEPKKAETYLRNLIEKATNDLGARGEFDLGDGRRRYALVQCTRDLNGSKCKQCLEAMMDKVPQCCEQKQGWFVGAPNCLIKYDDYMFYQLSSPTNPNATRDGAVNSANKVPKAMIISSSTLVAVAILSLSIYYFWQRKNRKDEVTSDNTPIFYDHSQSESSFNTDLPLLSLSIIQQSTNNFSETSKLGHGGFGAVYKGTMPDGREIAVKRLSQASSQGLEEFKNEVIFIAKLQHKNLVRLLGCCVQKNERLLAYEYMPNFSLDCQLFNIENRKKLDWKQRLNIINGIARGILYLHEDSRLKVIHRDLKASNILLDHEMTPKISDFGLARTFEGAQNQGNTRRVMGTFGYMAPEYVMEGLFSVKSDVFSFGVLLLEIICGKKNSSFYHSGQSLPIYTWNLWCKGKCLELMDPMLKEFYVEGEVLKCIHIGLLCVQEDAVDRPIMSSVVMMLGSDSMTFPKPNRPAFSIGRSVTRDSNSEHASVNEATMSNITPR